MDRMGRTEVIYAVFVGETGNKIKKSLKFYFLVCAVSFAIVNYIKLIFQSSYT